MSEVLAMFPLGTVLFPHGYLPLHVFEDRYRRLTHDCLAGDRRFGVVLIDRGHEVGGGDHRTDLGTVAEIVQAQEAPDGRWALACVGRSRLRVVEWLEEAPYPRATVEILDEAPWPPDAGDALAVAERTVRRSLALRAELDEPTPPIDVPVGPDPDVAAWQLASLAPLGPLDRQRLLAVDDPTERLRVLAALTDEECTVLAQRLAGF
ncbi:MAG TPA: LON peptidase substrate-binding domain-containing protein [Acidimicrobiales bacterium]|nr:LON peptidase substrate-binding domain-containing protein [Acidimicrobiales bacterium]